MAVADTFICEDCESKQLFYDKREHKREHPVVFIRNADEPRALPTTESRIAELERKVNTFDERFSSLETSMEKILSMLSEVRRGSG